LIDKRNSQRTELRHPTGAEFAKLSSSKKMTLIIIRRAQIGSRLMVNVLRLASAGRH
jgi:hypothetical protein